MIFLPYRDHPIIVFLFNVILYIILVVGSDDRFKSWIIDTVRKCCDEVEVRLQTFITRINLDCV